MPVALLIVAPAYSANAESEPPGDSNAKASDVAVEETIYAGSQQEKVICKRDRATGSRVTVKRVCKTAQMWEVERRESRRTIEKGQNERTWEDR